MSEIIVRRAASSDGSTVIHRGYEADPVLASSIDFFFSKPDRLGTQKEAKKRVVGSVEINQCRPVQVVGCRGTGEQKKSQETASRSVRSTPTNAEPNDGTLAYAKLLPTSISDESTALCSRMTETKGKTQEVMNGLAPFHLRSTDSSRSSKLLQAVDQFQRHSLPDQVPQRGVHSSPPSRNWAADEHQIKNVESPTLQKQRIGGTGSSSMMIEKIPNATSAFTSIHNPTFRRHFERFMSGERLPCALSTSVSLVYKRVNTHSWTRYCPSLKDLERSAYQQGFVGVIDWLGATASHTSRADYVMERLRLAAQKGNLAWVRWLHGNISGQCPRGCHPSTCNRYSSTTAKEEAAAAGQLEVLRWLHHNCKGRCRHSAFEQAASSGHLHVIKWLHHIALEEKTAKSTLDSVLMSALERVRALLKTNYIRGDPRSKKMEKREAVRDWLEQNITPDFRPLSNLQAERLGNSYFSYGEHDRVGYGSERHYIDLPAAATGGWSGVTGNVGWESTIFF